MAKAWQYYYFLIRDLNADVKMMNAHLCKNLPPEGHLEALGGASDQQDLKSPSLILSAHLCPCHRPSQETRLWGKVGDLKGVSPSCSSSPSSELSPTTGAKQMIGQSSGFSIHLLVSQIITVPIPTARSLSPPPPTPFGSLLLESMP